MRISSVSPARADRRGPTFWHRLVRAAQALDDHWIGDLIGAVSLFGTLWIALVAGWVLQ